MNSMRLRRQLFGLICLVVTCGAVLAADKKESVQSPAQTDFRVMAVVGGEDVSEEEFLVALRKEAREKFYHGKVSEAEMAKFREEVANRLITKVALIQEAKRRGIKVDMARVKDQLQKLDEKFSKQQGWADYRSTVMPVFERRLVGDELLKTLEEQVRDLPKPDTAKVKAYYEANADKFTAPEKWHVSLIMLKVDPSSSKDVWEAAVNEAADLVERIRSGASFEELARIHSGDDSALNGGDMGYLHTGMLAKPAQDVLNLMAVGEISEPVILLQGVAVFRLNGIQTANLNSYEKVAERAEALYLRQQKDQAWQNFVVANREKTPFTINKEVVSGADGKETKQ